MSTNPRRQIVAASSDAATRDAVRNGLRATPARALPYAEAAEDAGLTRDEYMRRMRQSAADTRTADRARAESLRTQDQVRACPDSATALAVAEFVALVCAHHNNRRAVVCAEILLSPNLAPYIPGVFGEWARATTRARQSIDAPPTRGVVVQTRDPETGARVVRVTQSR